MNAKQFLRKFPRAERNTNCLTGIACPKCGNRHSFNVEVKVVVEMVDQGTDGWGDSEHDDSSYCCCNECNHEATVKDFTIEGLDAEIERRSEQ